MFATAVAPREPSAHTIAVSKAQGISNNLTEGNNTRSLTLTLVVVRPR